MPTISVPGKIILFGEWAVVEGGMGIASALDCRMQIRAEPFDGTGIIYESGGERASAPDPRQPVEGFFSLASQIVADLMRGEPQHDSQWHGQKISFDPGWRLEEGLGSSSAVVLGLCALDYVLKGGVIPPEQDFWLQGRRLIRKFTSPRASGLDLAAQVMGHHVLLQGNDPHPLRLDIPPQLRILHTGQKESTQRALAKKQITPEFAQGIQNSVVNFLATRDWVTAIQQHARLLDEFGVMPQDITQAGIGWMRRGWARAFKTTGAGGGDALMVWTEPEHFDSLSAEIRERGWWWGKHRLGAESWRIHVG